jgi:hypothetical protein
LQARDELALAAQYDEKVTFLGKEYSNAALIKEHQKYFKKEPDQWTRFDTCQVGIEKVTTPNGPDVKLAADCRALFHRGGHVSVAMQRFLWGGMPVMKVQLIGDAVTRKRTPDGAMLEEKETKERVGVLMVSD